MAIVQDTDPNRIIVDNADGLKVAKKRMTGDGKGKMSPSFADRIVAEVEVAEEIESGQPAKKKRMKSVFIRVWRYVKESWLGVMSGTGKWKFPSCFHFRLNKTL